MIRERARKVLEANLASIDDKGLKVFSTAGMGLGVKSTTELSMGEFLCEYTGKVISTSQAKANDISYAMVGWDQQKVTYRAKQVLKDSLHLGQTKAECGKFHHL